ncbi:LADA_0A02388g1_1 [Lachancea dasiensis]|uniref:Protein BIG1 n=1 Tax=Lachancea dasiensis TaxID=1072105 RepID=A0A1G4IMY2_9SACH|nr:LADA_0A02388g1_1 [Lachancea dasiensis]
MRILWWTLLQLTLAMAGSSSKESAPALLFSYKLTPGLLNYQVDYNESTILPQSLFLEIAELLISGHRSDAYLFINIPGLTASDFSMYRTSLKFLETSIRSSSTALRFEKAETNGDGTDNYQKLIAYAQEEWEIEDHIDLRGNHTQNFERYIDWRPRTIRVEFEPAPEEYREDYFSYCDKILKHVLGQLPTPDNTVILTSLSSGGAASKSIHEAFQGVRIFPEVFQDPMKLSDHEKNPHSALARGSFNARVPKFSGMTDERLSALDPEFLNRHRSTLQIVVAATVGYAMLQIFLTIRRRKVREPSHGKVSVEKKKQ